MFESQTLLLFAALYLLLLFAVAKAGDHGLLPRRLIHHPATYALTLCIYTSAWTIYACIGYAQRYGFNFLAFFIGASGVFLLAALFLAPTLKLSRHYQLNSLADFFAFRYHSKAAGSITTLLLLVTLLPLMALQLQAIATTINLLSDNASNDTTSFFYCLLLLVFTLFLGIHTLSPRQKHEGLIAAIAFESLFKLLLFVGIAVIAFFSAFGDTNGFSHWLAQHPEAIQKMYAPLQSGTWHTLIIAFFLGIIAMPHLFHMAFSENLKPGNLNSASWSFPLLLLITALCIPFILWAAQALGAPTQADYYIIGIGLSSSPWVALLGFFVGLSATSGMLLVTALALASMCMNHLFLPLGSRPIDDIYQRLVWLKRLVIAAIFLLAWCYLVLAPPSSLMQLGSLSFVAALQFAPGFMGLLLWPRANRNGLFAGLLAGFSVWVATLLLPSLGLYPQDNSLLQLLRLDSGDALQQRYNIGIFSLIANSAAFIAVSLITRTQPDEQQAAEACALNTSQRSYRLALVATSIDDFQQALATPLGPITARKELILALDDLSLQPTEARPFALRRLRDRLESNLSGLLGPSIASELINTHLPYRHKQPAGPEDTQLIEARIEQYRDQLSGLAAELDSLRRFHRQTLLELPMGVISLSDEGEIIGWNRAMEQLTHVSALDIIGAHLEALPAPWNTPLQTFADQADNHEPRCELTYHQQRRWLSLSKSRIKGSSANEPSNGLVIVVEDITSHHLLQQSLAHHERLASIGRLAAGVAHEIGNPVTAIACLAQNLEYAADDLDEQEIIQNMQQITNQTQRISRIVESLVTFSHSGQQQHTAEPLAVNIYRSCDEAISLLQLDANYQQHQFNNLVDESHEVAGDAQRLLQVFINLLNNAADASESTSPITLRSYAEGQDIIIEVEDQGSGIDPAVRDHLFDPFVTSKAPGRGTGLGLALIYSIMEEHNGSITVVSPVSNGRGSCFRLRLPAFVMAATTSLPLEDDPAL